MGFLRNLFKGKAKPADPAVGLGTTDFTQDLTQSLARSNGQGKAEAAQPAPGAAVPVAPAPKTALNREVLRSSAAKTTGTGESGVNIWDFDGGEGTGDGSGAPARDGAGCGDAAIPTLPSPAVDPARSESAAKDTPPKVAPRASDMTAAVSTSKSVGPASTAPASTPPASTAPAQAAPAPITPIQAAPAIPAPKGPRAGAPQIRTPQAKSPEAAPSAMAGEPGKSGARTRRNKTRIIGFESSNSDVVSLFDAGGPGESAGPAIPSGRTNAAPMQGAEDTRMAAPAQAEDTADLPHGWLTVTDGPGRGHVLTLTGAATDLGRSADLALDFGDAGIAPTHATLRFRDGAFHIEPDSAPMSVDGATITGPTRLANGATLRLGATSLRLAALCGPEFGWAPSKEASHVATA